MYNRENPNSVKELFDTIASGYDFSNNLMSLGFHNRIKKKSIQKLPDLNEGTILDLCCGTGDMLVLLSKKYPKCKVIGIDFSKGMLEIAEKKTKKLTNIRLEIGDVTNLKYENVDLVNISFGLRNLPNFQTFLEQVYSVLKRDGILSILDLGRPTPPVSYLYNIYFNQMIPKIGSLGHKKETPYQYLVESLKSYPTQTKMVEMLIKTGFKTAQNTNYFGGIIAQQIAKK